MAAITDGFLGLAEAFKLYCQGEGFVHLRDDELPTGEYSHQRRLLAKDFTDNFKRAKMCIWLENPETREMVQLDKGDWPESPFSSPLVFFTHLIAPHGNDQWHRYSGFETYVRFGELIKWLEIWPTIRIQSEMYFQRSQPNPNEGAPALGRRPATVDENTAHRPLRSTTPTVPQFAEQAAAIGQLATDPGPCIDMVALWTLAKEMAEESRHFTPEDYWHQLMAAFWPGELAPNGLTLIVGDGKSPGADVRYVLNRFELAMAALGEAEFRRRGAEGACQHLLTWNKDDYAHVSRDRPEAEMTRCYFSTEEPLRGLFTRRSEFERWRKETGKTGASRDIQHEKKSTKTNSNDAVQPSELAAEAATVKVAPAIKTRRTSDRKIIVAVLESLPEAEAEGTGITQVIRECAQNLRGFPSNTDEQIKLVDRVRRQVRKQQKAG